MARKKNKSHHKKGGVAPPGPADTPSKVEQEADVQSVTSEPVSEVIVNGASPPSSPRSPLSDTSVNSVNKDCDSPSTTEDHSFASCLTEEPSSISESIPVDKPIEPSKEVNGIIPHHPDSSLSVSESAPQNNLNKTQNGIKKDSEYESAEEVDLPSDPKSPVVTKQPSAENCLPAPASNEGQKVTEESVCLDNIVTEKNGDSVCVVADEALNADEKSPVSDIHESLVTVTKNEIIEESISQKTCIEKEVTHVISNHITNGEVHTDIVKEEEHIDSIDVKESVTKNHNIETECNNLENSKEVVNVIQNSNLKDNLDDFKNNKIEKEVAEITNANSLVSNENNSEVNGHNLINNENNKEFNQIQDLNRNNIESQESFLNDKNSKVKSNDNIIENCIPHNSSDNNKQCVPDTENILNDCEKELSNSNDIKESKESTKVKESQDSHVKEPIQNTENKESLQESDVSTPTKNDFLKEETLPNNVDQSEQSINDPEDLPLPTPKQYNLDFLDNLDDPNFNPFATKTAVRNTPPSSPDPSRKLPPLKPAVKKKKDNKSVDLPVDETDSCKPDSSSEGNKVQDDQSNSAHQENQNAPLHVPTAEVDKSVPDNKDDSNQILEISFDDAPKPAKKPPPRLGKRPVITKKAVSKPIAKPKVVEKNNNKVQEDSVNEETKCEPEEDLPIPPSKGYNLDFLDNLEDPNFNPFQTKCAVSNSPPKDGFVKPDSPEIKPKAKVLQAKKVPAKKGFSAIKSKVTPDKQENHSKSVVEALPIENKKESSDNKPTEVSEASEELQLPLQKAYNLDFLDDPNFDPFQTRSSVHNVPNNGKDISKVDKVDQQVINESPSDNDSDVIKDSSSLDLESVANSCETKEQETCSEKTKEEETPIVCDNAEKDSIPIKTDVPKIKESNQISSDKNESVVNSQTNSVVTNNELENKLGPSIKDKFDDSEKSLEVIKKCVTEQEKVLKSPAKDSETVCDKALINIHKVPSIGTIGQLDSIEFEQLLGDEASRLAEEFMNISTDSALPEFEDDINSSMADKNCNTVSRRSAHLDENVNPFVKSNRTPRSPSLGKRDVCGAEGSEAEIDPFKPRSSLGRDSFLGDDRLDTSSLDDDSGIALGSRSDLETMVNHSEAGPEIATGMTSSDLQIASQFFKEATDIENQLRKSLGSSLRGSCSIPDSGKSSRLSLLEFSGSQSKLSGDEITPTKDKPEPSNTSTPEPQHKPVPVTSTPAAPPHEERSAPEGTSSPTPRPSSDTSEHKSSRPNSIPSSEGFMTTAEVQKLLKQQELQFEEKLLRSELSAAEKEKKLRQAMKDEQQERNHLGESVSELAHSRDSLLKLVSQYKGMLASLVSEKEKEKQNQEERIKTVEQEKFQALDDLHNVEVAFSDVHRKYERTKQVVDTLKRNEETLRGAVSDYEKKLQKQEQKFIEFQKHAEEKIQQANEEFETMRRANEQEMTKMSALLKKAEMKIMSLQDANDRKARENAELTQLCDDLINKVGSSP